MIEKDVREVDFDDEVNFMRDVIADPDAGEVTFELTLTPDEPTSSLPTYSEVSYSEASPLANEYHFRPFAGPELSPKKSEVRVTMEIERYEDNRTSIMIDATFTPDKLEDARAAFLRAAEHAFDDAGRAT